VPPASPQVQTPIAQESSASGGTPPHRSSGLARYWGMRARVR
jgi:hypothetical protein